MRAWVAIAAMAAVSCAREERRFEESAPGSAITEAVPMVSLHPGEEPAPRRARGRRPSTEEPSAQAISDGKRMFQTFNCVGCHANGGGGMGPPLMDERWIYGGEPENIFDTILEGRPNGMPSFQGKIDQADAWKLVAFVRSLSGQVPRDALPARSDHAQPANPDVPYRRPELRPPAEHP